MGRDFRVNNDRDELNVNGRSISVSRRNSVIVDYIFPDFEGVGGSTYDFNEINGIIITLGRRLKNLTQRLLDMEVVPVVDEDEEDVIEEVINDDDDVTTINNINRRIDNIMESIIVFTAVGQMIRYDGMIPVQLEYD
jgi:hypothetical protein